MQQHDTPAVPADERRFQDEIMRGEELFSMGYYRKALEIFRMVLTVDRENAYALNDAGMCFMELGETVEAVRFFEAALGHKPDFDSAFYNCIDALLRENIFDLALETFVHYGDAIPESEEKQLYRAGFEELIERAERWEAEPVIEADAA